MSKSRKQRNHRRNLQESRGEGPGTPAREEWPARSRRRGEAGPGHLLQFEITWEPMEDGHVKRLPEAVRERMEILHSIVIRNPAPAEKELRQLAMAYPEVVCFRNWLSGSLHQQGRKAEAKEITEVLFRDHPEYLFARTSLAEMALEAHDIEAADRLLTGDGVTLTTLYPGRKVFHISEVTHWFFVCGKLQLLKGNIEGAKAHRDFLNKVDPNCRAVQELDRRMRPQNLDIARIMASLRRFRALAGKLRKKPPARRLSHQSPDQSADGPDLFPDT